MRILMCLLVCVIVLWISLVPSFTFSAWVAPKLCSSTQGGPNICALLYNVAIGCLIAGGSSLIAGLVVWRAMSPPKKSDGAVR